MLNWLVRDVHVGATALSVEQPLLLHVEEGERGNKGSRKMVILYITVLSC